MTNLIEGHHCKPRILISGETGGTGASTTAKLLANFLELPLISGGKYFRALANRFQVFCEQHSDSSLDTQYLSFLYLYEERFAKDGLAGISTLIEEGIRDGAHGQTLARFSQAIEASSKRNGGVNPIWDYVVDQKTIDDALRQSGFVWEAKLAVLAFEIDQLAAVASRSDSAIPFLRVVLTLDPVVAAQRVGSREGREVAVDEIMVRKQHDFARYGHLYQIGGQKVMHEDLARFADIAINTENTDPNEVVAKILKEYLRLLSAFGEFEKSLALPVIDEIWRVLKQLQSVS
jgi:cytidylate kinase